MLKRQRQNFILLQITNNRSKGWEFKFIIKYHSCIVRTLKWTIYKQYNFISIREQINFKLITRHFSVIFISFVIILIELFLFTVNFIFSWYYTLALIGTFFPFQQTNSLLNVFEIWKFKFRKTVDNTNIS